MPALFDAHVFAHTQLRRKRLEACPSLELRPECAQDRACVALEFALGRRRSLMRSRTSCPPALARLGARTTVQQIVQPYVTLHPPRLTMSKLVDPYARRSREGRPSPLKKGQDRGPEGPIETQRHLAIRIRLQLSHRTRELTLFDLGLDSKLTACD